MPIVDVFASGTQIVSKSGGIGAEMTKFQMVDNVLVLINHMDQTPRTKEGKDMELGMRQSTAASFLGKSSLTEYVHPSSAYQVSFALLSSFLK